MNRNMQVMLVNPGLKPGGMTVDLKNLANGLRANGARVTCAGSLRQVVRMLWHSGDAAVLHLFGCLPSSTIFGAMAVARTKGVPVVWTPTFHPSRPHTYGRSFPHIAMRAFDQVAPRVARFVDAVVALTEEEQQYFASLGAPRVDVIPPGVDDVAPPLPESAAAAFRERHGLHEGPVVIVLGRSSPRHKGLTFCLDAFEALHARVPEAQLVLVGGLGVGSSIPVPNVHALGWVAEEDRDAALGAADLVFVPSAYEALSRAVVEGWAHGVPVVATDRVALAPLIEEERAGWVVPFSRPLVAGRILEAALSDKESRDLSANRGRLLVRERFRLHDIVSKTLALYEVTTGRGAA
jgi:glycosyltransferase involved in cell wall biosynthesis